jgi:hypothetical protein
MATGHINSKEIQDTYRDVLLIEGTDNDGLDGTLKYLRDGLGTNSTLKLSTTKAKFTADLEVSGVINASGGVAGDLVGNVTGNVTGGLIGVATQAGTLYSSTSIIDDDYPVLIVPDYGAPASGYYNMKHNDTITYNPTTEILKTKDIELTGTLSAIGVESPIHLENTTAANRFTIAFTDCEALGSITSDVYDLQHNVQTWIQPSTGEMGCVDLTSTGAVEAVEFNNGVGATIYDTATTTFTGDLNGNADTATLADSIALSGMPQLGYKGFYGRQTVGTGAPEILTDTQARATLNVADGADNTSLNTCNTPNVQSNWNAVAGDSVILNKPDVYSKSKHIMQWSLRWHTDANPSAVGGGVNRRRWFTFDKTFGPNDYIWNSYSTDENPPTAWYDSQTPGIVIPKDMTLLKYGLKGSITWGDPADTGDLLLELKTNTNPLTWDGSVQTVPMTTLGTRQDENWTHQCWCSIEESGSWAMSEGDILLPFLARDDFLDSGSTRYVEGVFTLEFAVDLTT